MVSADPANAPLNLVLGSSSPTAFEAPLMVSLATWHFICLWNIFGFLVSGTFLDSLCFWTQIFFVFDFLILPAVWWPLLPPWAGCSSFVCQVEHLKGAVKSRYDFFPFFVCSYAIDCPQMSVVSLIVCLSASLDYSYPCVYPVLRWILLVVVFCCHPLSKLYINSAHLDSTFTTLSRKVNTHSWSSSTCNFRTISLWIFTWHFPDRSPPVGVRWRVPEKVPQPEFPTNPYHFRWVSTAAPFHHIHPTIRWWSGYSSGMLLLWYIKLKVW